ncbi:uncharacterized protein CPUR_07613 [Claviceps purpurea 20.1]|uniref:Uncharacterized protein n=1 Tax=Claviceps purpurea (strain 20.1) TaxID=1111077 RepID=M1VY28_CLAP2|nr:hypothetical protein E4U38_006449 [Claviceps purpurea]KAG6167984.1 hypothetical protein E4U11_006260 [Claviceps purpurea]CCE33687.1 uncharacterized protein CPUR_07613 [Claviceps purpurea 20.1]
MPVRILPASAAAFAPRASFVTVVMDRVHPWLTRVLRRISSTRRALNNVPQHQKYLSEMLSSASAIWSLASLMLPDFVDVDSPTELPGSIFSSHQILHVEAYVVHVDMIHRHEVSFKLTGDSIDALVRYHHDIHCANAKASTYEWSGKEQQCTELHKDFIQAINKFVFQTQVRALEGLEEEGDGELLEGRSAEVKKHLTGLMKPLVPPYFPRTIDLVLQPPLFPFLAGNSMWAQPVSFQALPWASTAASEVSVCPLMAAYTSLYLDAAAQYFRSPLLASSLPPARQDWLLPIWSGA